jgi:hypothetical protein
MVVQCSHPDFVLPIGTDGQPPSTDVIKPVAATDRLVGPVHLGPRVEHVTLIGDVFVFELHQLLVLMAIASSEKSPTTDARLYVDPST